MEIRSINSITEYSHYKIKKSFLDSIFSFVGILLLVFILVESLKHLNWIAIGKIKNLISFYQGFFYTVIFIATIGILLLLTLIVYSILTVINSFKKINYYKEPRFSLIVLKEVEYDYKLWQTSALKTFHSQTIKLEIEEEERLFKTPIIFTNSKKIGFLNIPKILQSHSYVKNKAYIGYDPNLDEAVIISLKEKA